MYNSYSMMRQTSAFGPDAEVFTKSQPMSAVGFGAPVGLAQDKLGALLIADDVGLGKTIEAGLVAFGAIAIAASVIGASLGWSHESIRTP